LSAGTAGLIKYATIAGIITSTIASAITTVKGSNVPQYAEGVIGLQGAGTETSDSILARLSKNESVMTAKETKEHRPVLESIRKGDFDKHYFDKESVIKMVQKYENAEKQNFADNVAASLSMLSFGDNHEDLMKLRAHGGNTVYWLKKINKTIEKNDFKKVL
jgi:hypothetical protein